MNKWEKQITTWAEQFEYPPTPDVSQRVFRPEPKPVVLRPRKAWALAVLIGLLASLLLVPEVRATAVAVIRAGAGTIFVGEWQSETAVPEGIAAPRFMIEITSAEAVKRVPDLRTPAKWGAPDQLFLYEGGVPEVIVQVWLAEDGQTAEAAFYHTAASPYFNKAAERIEETAVNDVSAFWIDGPHLFRVNQSWEEWRFIDSSVLIWWSADVTYRLESYLTLEDAIQAAEMLVPLQEVLQDE